MSTGMPAAAGGIEATRREMLFGLSSAAIALAIQPALARAQAGFPDRPLKLVVGFPAGGQSDIMARLVGEALSRQLKQPVVVENRAGASGTIAAEFVARQKADGYTLMLTSEAVQSRAAAVFKKIPYDPLQDFSMIRKVSKQKAVVVVSPASPYNSVKDIVAQARELPGKVSYGSTFGTTSQFAGAVFCQLNSVTMNAVNYPGDAKAVTDLMGGFVDVGFFVESAVEQLVKSGKLRALAVISDEPSMLFPSLPTMRQSGVVAMEVAPWFGVVAPAGTPAAIVEQIGGALAKAGSDPEVGAKLARFGAIWITDSSPEKFTNDIRNEVAYWKKFVKDANLPLME